MELVKKDTKNNKAIVKALEKEGLDDSFIASTLKHIATNAITQNNKGDEIEDFHAKLKAIQTIVKIKDRSFDQQGGVNLNFFQAPNLDELKY